MREIVLAILIAPVIFVILWLVMAMFCPRAESTRAPPFSFARLTRVKL